MKELMRKLKIAAVSLMVMMAGISGAMAQKIDEIRMERDIEVAENVLSTLIKQQFEQRMFFPMEITGTYQPGHGVTFRLPADYATPMALTIPRGSDSYIFESGHNTVTVVGGTSRD